MTDNTKRVFISYSRENVEFARKLAKSLSEAGAKVWIDVENIPAGMNWSSAIQEGLNICESMILIISPASMASRNVENEWQYFLDQGKRLIPVLLKPVQSPHFQLSRIQHIDFYNHPYETALEKLALELEFQKAIGFPIVRNIPSTEKSFADIEPFVAHLLSEVPDKCAENVVLQVFQLIEKRYMTQYFQLGGEPNNPTISKKIKKLLNKTNPDKLDSKAVKPGECSLITGYQRCKRTDC
jgi:hypothetical protein